MSVALVPGRSKARLQRPDFPVPLRLTEAAAIVADPRRGKVVELARRHAVSRQTASGIVNKVRHACMELLAPKSPGRPPRTHSIVVDPHRIEAAVVSLAVDAHASNSGTQACIQSLLDEHVATGRISTILKHAATRATQQLQALPMPDAPVYAAADELYDHGRPVLALMEDQHLGVLLASKEDEADGTTWGFRLLELQERGLRYAHLVTDQGTAMAAGFAESQVLAAAAHGSDAFHFLYALGRDARALVHQATRAQAEFEKVTAALDYHTAPSHGRGRPRQQTTLAAYERAAAAAAQANYAAKAADFLFHETRALLEPVDQDGHLLTAATARTGLDTVAVLLADLSTRTRPLATLIARAGPALHAFRAPLAERHQELCQRYGSELVAFVGWTWIHRQALHETLPRTQEELDRRWGLDVPLEHVAAIWHTFRNCHRSSSVLESFNSILRLHVQAHRGLTPSLLPLIVYRHNARVFPRGVHRGEAPFVVLGILPPDDRTWVERLLATPSADSASQGQTPPHPAQTPAHQAPPAAPTVAAAVA